MIKNDALNEFFDLQHRWGCLQVMAEDNEFETEFFQLLAVHTFAYLFPYSMSETLPREITKLLFPINKFAFCPERAISAEHEAARLVARSFCTQIAHGWIGSNNEISEDEFFVICGEDSGMFIDANTFDLSDIIHFKANE